MTTKEFIERAIEGGWNEREQWKYHNSIGKHHRMTAFEGEDVQEFEVLDAEVLLDPEAWKAVGKVEGWYDSKELIPNSWLMKQVEMVLALAEGKTIEEYLETL